MVKVIEQSANITISDFEIKLLNSNRVVMHPIQDDKIVITDKACVMVSQDNNLPLWYVCNFTNYLWKNADTCDETDYDNRLLVGAALFQSISIIDIYGKEVPFSSFPFDLSIPSRMLDGVLLPPYLYSFSMYFSSIPDALYYVRFKSYNISNSISAITLIPITYEKLYSNDRDRNIISYIVNGDKEYKIPFNTTSGEFGKYYYNNVGSAVTLIGEN